MQTSIISMQLMFVFDLFIDIMKKTDPSNPDYPKLELAISKLDEVTRYFVVVVVAIGSTSLVVLIVRCNCCMYNISVFKGVDLKDAFISNVFEIVLPYENHFQSAVLYTHVL